METVNELIGKYFGKVRDTKLSGIGVLAFKVIAIDGWEALGINYDVKIGGYVFENVDIERMEFFDEEKDALAHAQNLLNWHEEHKKDDKPSEGSLADILSEALKNR